jgi:hypothetical protein
MIFISHRGNIDGKKVDQENTPEYIDAAIHLGFDVEIDLWVVNGEWYLGHDEPQYTTTFDWIEHRSNKLWVHCKNKEAVEYFIENDFKCSDINWFWHENDMMTLTTFGYAWVYPGRQPIRGSIAVMPEINNDGVSQCMGICSDIIQMYKNESKQIK